ncbi:hypothetical protein ACFW04_013354 [Cataglyphis niger]
MWKLVIKLDLTTLNNRYEQISTYLQETKKMCDTMKLQNHYHQDACSTLDIIAKREARYLKNMTQIQTIFKPPTNRRRGLVDGKGSIAKSLFGTMDANDEKRINEQLDLLENRQKLIQHVEDIIDRNEKTSATTVYTERAEINEHFIIITAVITELKRDAEIIIEYLTYTRKETMHPKLIPIEAIIINLKEATQQLQRKGTEHTTISAFYDKKAYIILQFSLITQPSYDIKKVITLHIHIHNNTFIAIDKEKLTYFRENDLRNYLKKNTKYTCKNAILIYRTSRNAPCEIQLYTQSQHNCKTKTINSIKFGLDYNSHILGYTQLTKPTNKIIKNTGKILLRGKCKLKMPDMTIQSTKIAYKIKIETYLPELNITLLQDEKKTHDNGTLKDVTTHRAESKTELEKLNTNVQDNEQKFFAQKQFVYPMATSGLIIIIIIKKIKQSSVRICEEEPRIFYGLPRPILKHSLSTRF